jgi:phosphoglycolate phosphatase
MSIRTVLFDLDGTLADTAPDLAHTLNTLLAEEGRAPLAYETIRPEVSHGAGALVRLGFGEVAGADLERLRGRFLSLYTENLVRETRLFPGMSELLTEIKRRGLNWGIVTNKPAFLTEPLMARLGLPWSPASIVSGDSTNNRKPHPEPMLLACTQAGSEPAQCLYVGDAERDIEAGRRAGMRTLVALFGYISQGERPERWGADGLIRAPREVLNWLDADTRMKHD